MERTRKVNRRTDEQTETDGRTDGGHDIIRPVFNGRIRNEEGTIEYLLWDCHQVQEFLYLVKQKFYVIDILTIF